MAELYPSTPQVIEVKQNTLDSSAVAEILTSHTVEITSTLNLNRLMPYLIENKCLTLGESGLFKSSDSENNIQFIEIVNRRGSSALHGLLVALSQYTTREPSEIALIELANKLREDVDRALSQYKPSAAPKHDTEVETEPFVEDSVDTSPIAPSSPRDQQAGEETGEGNSKQEKNQYIPGVPDFIIFFLRAAGFAMFGLSVPLIIAGSVILAFSFQEFAGVLDCDGVGIKHSLSVFNFFFALLCFGGPVLLLLFCLYFKFEDPNTKWKKKHRFSRFVVWVQTFVFLTVFILIVLELLFSLLYIIPELINHYSDWRDLNQQNATNCAEEIYLTSFSIVTVSYSVVFLLLVVLGVFLANHYFQWVSDEKDPGVLIKVIYACLGRKLEHSL